MIELNEKSWNQRIKPVETWLEHSRPTDEEEEDRIKYIESILRRLKRNPNALGDILKQLKTEFSNEIQNGDEMFADWWPTHRHTNSDPKKCGLCRHISTAWGIENPEAWHMKIQEFVESHVVKACDGCDQLYSLDESKYQDDSQAILPLGQLDGHDCCPHCENLPTPQVMKYIHAFFETNLIDYQCSNSHCSKSISTLGEAFKRMSYCVSDYEIFEYLDVLGTGSLLSKLEKENYEIIQFSRDLITSYAKKTEDDELLYCESCLDGDSDFP
jgi:hypothetical protein